MKVALVFTALLCPLVWFSFSTPARAQTDPQDDVLVLRDGTILRGRVAESIPGRSTIIVLSDGRSREIEGDQIVSAHGPAFTVGPKVDTRAPLVVESPHRTLSLGEPNGVAVVRGRAHPVYRKTCDTPCTVAVDPEHAAIYADEVGGSSFSLAWSGAMPPTGAHLQLWDPRDLAAEPTMSDAAVARQQIDLRERLRGADLAEAERRRYDAERARRIARVRTAGWTMVGVGLGGLLAGGLVLGLGSVSCGANTACEHRVTSGGIGTSVTGALIVTPGILMATLGAMGGYSYSPSGPRPLPIPTRVPIFVEP